jgi:hypothetical protein
VPFGSAFGTSSELTPGAAASRHPARPVRHDCPVDEHARRVTAPVRVALEGFERGYVTVADLQAAVAAAAGALDNSNVGLVQALGALAEELEEIRFALPQEDQLAAVRTRSSEARALLDAEQ